VSGPQILTFGCRLNASESDAMRALVPAEAAADLVIVNTCAVTAEAERQARQAIRRARRERPDARIVVTGCAAQIRPETFAAMPEVDRVIGNAEKLDAAQWQAPSADRVVVADIMAIRETAGHLASGFTGRARAFLEIQHGCDHRCTFCIIPFGRGPSRSVPMGRIVEAARALVAQGMAEIVLTGVDITAYGHDLPGRPGLAQLVRRLLAAVPALPRLRLSSLDPAEVEEELIALFGSEPRLAPHVHLSLQAGDGMILKRMKRRHDPDQAEALCARLRAARPDIVLGADLIAGFPTEDEAMFARGLDHVAACGLSLLHVFPFSPRAGTPAARMPQVPAAERRLRAKRLREAGAAALARTLAACVGQRMQVLVEEPGIGRSEHFLPVRIDGAATPGRIIEAIAARASAAALYAHAA